MNKAIVITLAIALVGLTAGCSSDSHASTATQPSSAAEAPGDTPAPTLAAQSAADGAPKSFDTPPKPGQRATCPVMESEFVVTDKSERSSHQGKHVAFCCPGCKSKFDSDPKKYL